MYEPLFLGNSEKKAIVVFIHGFMGSPRLFDGFARKVHSQGYSATSLLLPGHGKTTKAFSSSTKDQWQDHVNAEIERFSADYGKIFLVGHSMGCLLAINAAVKHSEYVQGLFLMACPLKLRIVSLISIKTLIKQVFRRRNHPMKSAYLDGSSIPLYPTLLWRSVRPIVELKKLIRITKRDLCGVCVPVTAVYALSDEVVSMRSLGILKSCLDKSCLDCITLSDSLHAYYPEHELSELEEALVTAIERSNAR